MASRLKRKKCLNCGKLFLPDPRNTKRQRYCCEPDCRKAAKADSQRRWLMKPENRDYFKGPEHVLRVQRWRKKHPGYWRKRKTKVNALQESLIEKPPENTTNKDHFAPNALQDSLIMQSSVIVGLIAQLTGSALQDDIAMATRRMQQLGNDILNPQSKGGCHGSKAGYLPRAGP